VSTLPDHPEGGWEENAIAAFTRRAELVGSVVHRCAAPEKLASIVVSLAGTAPVAGTPAFVGRFPALAAAVGARVELFVPRDAEEAARATVGISIGEAMVAETGSVLVTEHDLPDRLVSMLSPTLVQVVPAASILRTLDEVGLYLSRVAAGGVSGYQALVTGPSRSADIERSLTIGVQGPAELHVVIFDGHG
jgi:L-lactate dehydrogenase complex protein LldG